MKTEGSSRAHRKSRYLKRTIFGLCGSMALILAACGSTGNGSSGSSDGSVEISVVTAFPLNSSNNRNLNDLSQWLDENAGGRVSLDLIGGPEAVPVDQQGQALSSGAVDALWTVHAYLGSFVPVLNGMRLNELDNEALREGGAFEFIDSLYKEKVNARVWGFPSPGLSHNLYTNFSVSSLDDFEGQLMRSSPVHEAFLKSLGAEPIVMEVSDIYDAMERGTVSGYGYVTVGLRDFGLEEVTANAIYPSFYSSDAVALINQDFWEGLPEDVRAILNEGMEIVEGRYLDINVAEAEAEREALAAAGVNVVELEGPVAEEYLARAEESAWSELEAVDPENARLLRSLISDGE